MYNCAPILRSFFGNIVMKFLTIVIILRYYTKGQGQVSAWTCGSPVQEVYRRENTDAQFQFDVSGYLPQQSGVIASFSIAFYDGTPLANVIYMYQGSIMTDPAIGVNVTANVTGKIEMTLTDVKLKNAGTYRIDSIFGTLGCNCLYILGIPVKPTLSINSSAHVNGSTTFTCRSSSTTFPSNHSLTLIYNWKVDNVDNPTGSRYHYSTNRNTLTLSDLVKEDASKKFTCSATEDVSDNGYTSSSSDSFILNVIYGPDKPIISVQSPYTVREDDTPADIRCSSSCYPGCTYSWTNVTIDTVISTNAVLALDTVNRYMTGSYKCTAINLSSEYRKSEDATLSVIVKNRTVGSLYIEGYYGQTDVAVDEEAKNVKFTCIVDATPASTIKIMFEGAILNEQPSTTATLSFIRRSVTCSDAGVYSCEALSSDGLPSSKNVTLFVRCSPRPLHKVIQNITTALYVPVTLRFTALAYPEPGFTWHKEYSKNWIQLLSNADLLISSVGLQSNLTIQNVSRTDYGHYRVTVENVIGTYEQSLLLSEDDVLHGDRECNENESDNTATVIAGVLGSVCVVVIVYAVCLTMLYKRKPRNSDKQSPVESTKQTTYANLSFTSDVRDNQEVDKDAPDIDSAEQYTDLVHSLEKDKDTYDVIQKI